MKRKYYQYKIEVTNVESGEKLVTYKKARGPAENGVLTSLKRFVTRSGTPHNEDGPSEIHPDGSLCWRKNGKLHRTDGPALENEITIEYYYFGLKHRIDGPARIYKKNKTEEWYLGGQLHREDGPAVIYFDEYSNEPTFDWYLHGDWLDFEKYLDFVEPEVAIKLKLQYSQLLD